MPPRAAFGESHELGRRYGGSSWPVHLPIHVPMPITLQFRDAFRVPVSVFDDLTKFVLIATVVVVWGLWVPLTLAMSLSLI